MSFLKTLGLGAYYRVRRMKKALKNWRKFGVIIFGSLFVASSLMVPSVLAQDFRVEVYHNGSRISGLIVDANSTSQFTARAFHGTQEVTNSTQFIWARNAVYQPSDLGTISSSGLFSAGPTDGFYSGALKARGSYNGYSDTDAISITINPVTPPPAEDILNQVEIYDAQGNRISGFIADAGSSKQLYAKAYDTEGDDITSVTSFAWSTDNRYLLSDLGTINNNGLYTVGPTDGFYSGAIRVVGSYNGNSDLDVASVTINDTTPPPPVNTPPSAQITPYPVSGTVPLSTTLDASASFDTDGSIVKYEWDRDGNGTYEFVGGATTPYTYTSIGVYTPRVRVTDNDGATDYAITSVYVTRTPVANQPPVASITANPSSGYTPLSTSLNANGSYDVDGTIVKYEWDRDGNGTYEVTTSWDSTSYTYGLGTHYPRVRVTDNDGASDIASTTVVVTQGSVVNQPPVAHIIPSPANGYAPLNTTLNASSSFDVDGFIVSYDWDWDGNGVYDHYSGSSSIVSHTYGVGTYSPRVRVTDNDGAVDIASTTVIAQDIWIQQEYLVGVNGWANDNSLYNYESTSLSSYSWSNLRNPLPGATYRWEKLNGVGYLSGNLYSQNGARFNANNVEGSVTLRVTATWGGNSVSDTVIVYVNQHIVPPPPPVPDTPIYTNFVSIVEGGGTACDNDIIRYTIKLANFEQNLVSGVRLKMDIPSYTKFLSASSTVDHPRLEDGVIVWDAGTIYTNETKTLVVRVMLNDNVPATYIQGNAYVAYDQLGGNFNIKSNKIYTCGETGPIEPLTPTGVNWMVLALLAMISLGLTTLTYGYFRNRADQMISYQ